MKFIKKLIILIIAIFFVYSFLSFIEVNNKLAEYNKKYSNVIINKPNNKLNTQYYFYKINYNFIIDSKGFPNQNIDGNIVIHPIQIIHLGIEKISNYEYKNNIEIDNILKLGRYLLKLIKIRTFNGIEYGLISIDFYNKYYPFAGSSWISSMTQGQALSFLLRLHALTGDQEFFQAATYIFNSFKIPLSRGGVVFEKNGFLWTEEVVSIPPTHILNGNIFALLGVYDYWLVTRDEYARKLFDKGIKSVLESLEKYSLGKWSYYDDPNTGWAGLSHPGYQVLHPILLDILYNITGEAKFQEYAQLWREGQQSVVAKGTYILLRNYFRLLRVLNRHKYTTIPYE